MNTTVLLIDARPGPLGDTRSLLEDAGYRVITAEDASSGLCAYERAAPGIVVVDSRLPGSPPTTLCRELRAIERQKGTRVALVMLARGGGKKSRRTTDEAAPLCDSILRQPVERSLLLSTLAQLAGPGSFRNEQHDLPERPSAGAIAGLEHEIDIRLDSLTADSPRACAMEAEEDALLDEVVDELLREEGTADGASRKHDIQGTLNSLHLGEIVQMLALGGKTAKVGLDNGATRGEVWFESGMMTHAVRGEAIGEHAFFDMVCWRSGRFTIQHGLRCENRSLNQDAMYLVLEGMRLMDEARAERPLSTTDADGMELVQRECDRNRSPEDAAARYAVGPDHAWIASTPSLQLARPRPGNGHTARQPAPARLTPESANRRRRALRWRSIAFAAGLLGAVATVWALIAG